jgi:hypothetical protein
VPQHPTTRKLPFTPLIVGMGAGLCAAHKSPTQFMGNQSKSDAWVGGQIPRLEPHKIEVQPNTAFA